MRLADFGLRFRVTAEFLVCHSTEPRLLSPPVNEPAVLWHAPKSPWTSTRESQIGGWAAWNPTVDVPTNAWKDKDEDFPGRKSQVPQTALNPREAHRTFETSTLSPNESRTQQTTATPSAFKRQRDPARVPLPNQEKNGHSRLRCPLDLGLPIGGTRRT